MKSTIVYIHPAGGGSHWEYAARFAHSMLEFPPMAECKLVVVCNGHSPSNALQVLFESFDNCEFWEHNNDGWDIGAYLSVAPRIETEMVFCCGESVYFKRAGWLKRLEDCEAAFGRGMYGIWCSYQVRPHVCTTAFYVSTDLVRLYPLPVHSKAQRYEFEHGDGSLHHMVRNMGFPVLLVTWDGEYDEPHWRLGKNIFMRGDQSNCLAFNNHTDGYSVSPDWFRRELERKVG